MTREEFRTEIETIVEAPAGSVREEDVLRGMKGWSSLASIDFIAMADEKLGASVDASALARCKTVGDLMALFPDQITD